MEEIEKDITKYDLIYALKHMRNAFECIERFKKEEDKNTDKVCEQQIQAINYYIERLKKQSK